MRKDKKIITTVICILSLIVTLYAKKMPSAIQMEESKRTCGTPFIAQNWQILTENTRRLHPEGPATLSKIADTQIDVGDTLSFFTINHKSYIYESIEAVCMYKSDLSYVFVGLQEFEDGRVTSENVDNFYRAFELQTPVTSIDPNKGIRSIMNQYIGGTPTTFGDNHVFILIYDIVDEFDPNNGSYIYIGGYLSLADYADGSYSNRKNVLYVDCAPQKVDGDGALATVAHEFQHLISYGYDPDDFSAGIWMNEGASEYSEVLCGFPLRDPTGYLQHPERSLTIFDQSYDNLLDYKKVALWTYYLAEKFGPGLIGEIVRDPKNSLEGVRSALVKWGISLSFEDIFSNFVIANYADDPSLDQNGYYGYKKIVLPAVPPATPHRAYPLSEQLKTIPQYAAYYARFLSQDTTAVLHVGSRLTDEIRDRLYLKGNQSTVEDITLDASKNGSYSLHAIGKGVDEIVLAAVGLGTVTSCSYSVTSEFSDIYAPVLTDGPNEFLPTGSSITIIWTTDEPASSLIEYGTNISYTNQVKDTSYVTSHNISLTNLQPNTTYHYRVGSADGRGNGPRYSADFSFTTTDVTAGTIAALQQAHSYGYLGRSLVHTKEGRIHLLFHEIEGDRRYINHISSAGNGATWSPVVKVDITLNYAGMPSVAVDSLGRLHAAWHAKEFSDTKYVIYYSQSDDGGLSWSIPVMVSKTITQYDQLYAAIAVDQNNNPHIVWNTALYSDENTGDVYHACSSDGGTTWSTDMIISQSTAHRCFVPTIDFTSTGKAYVLWVDGIFDQQTRKVYGTNSSDYLSWQTPQALTKSGVLYDTFVSFVIDPHDVLHMVYSDNYNPGDIRIMYTFLQSDLWSIPVPIAISQSGSVSGPNIACDASGDLYLLYRDDMGSAALGKNIAKPFFDAERPTVYKQNVAAAGEIFFSVFHKEIWSPASNISNDINDNLYPEMPRLVPSGFVDAIWMKVVTTTLNQIKYLHFSTSPPINASPLHVSTVYPLDGADNAPYFRQSFYVSVDFDQRVARDSLSNANVVVTSAGQGVITGQITYDPSLRRLTFVPSSALLPDDAITVKLNASITNDGGIGLDGNGNGSVEGSPTDDYIWSFRTQAKDVIAPVFSIGILQNPVLTRYMDIYMIPSEMLDGTPSVSIGGKAMIALLLPGQTVMYKTDYRLEQNGVIHIDVAGHDLAGNSGAGTKDFTAQFMLADAGGVIASTDAVVQLELPAGTLTNDSYLTIVKSSMDKVMNKSMAFEARDFYQIGPSFAQLAKPARLIFTIPQLDGLEYCIEQQQADGSWIEIASMQKEKMISAQVTGLGNFRLIRKDLIIPQAFALRQNYPNPFNLKSEQTTIAFELPNEANVEIVIYNILGERICSILNRNMPVGHHSLHWNGKDDAQNYVASGVYFYQCKVGRQTFTRKMLLLP